jgi:hypothetical protein
MISKFLEQSEADKTSNDIELKNDSRTRDELPKLIKLADNLIIYRKLEFFIME